MNLQISLKLKLIKINRVIKVEYSTYQKATFDEYLICSLALRSKNKKQIADYIDDISGNGSLNAHFNKLYDKIKDLSKEQIEKIAANSLFPVLKKDSSNNYNYYPQIDASVYRNRLYKGDLATYDNLVKDILRIDAELVKEPTFDERFTSDKPDTYQVAIDDSGLPKLMLCGGTVIIEPKLFEQIIVREFDGISRYNGKIHTEADGAEWHLFNKSAFENLWSSYNYFYLNGEDHCAIRKNDIRKTEIARLSGLYIYRETYIPYGKDSRISEIVLKILQDNRSLSILSSASIVALLKDVDPNVAVKMTNYLFAELKSPSKEIAEFVIERLRHGELKGWSKTTLQKLVSNCNTSDYSLIYRANPQVEFAIDQLLSIDFELLTEQDREKVIKYNESIEDMKKTITQIIGYITSQGLREAVKKLKADNDTKRFTKLCNERIGHEKNRLDNATYDEVVSRHNDALELKRLAEVIERKLSNIKK